jgi:hypothetical protein
MVIDTLFLCYAEDRDYANRSGDMEYTDSQFKVIQFFYLCLNIHYFQDYMEFMVRHERPVYGVVPTSNVSSEYL